jgi:hypothetical protein
MRSPRNSTAELLELNPEMDRQRDEHGVKKTKETLKLKMNQELDTGR